jgi:hypothetical protein
MVGYALFNGPSAFQARCARSRAKQQQQQQQQQPAAAEAEQQRQQCRIQADFE